MKNSCQHQSLCKSLDFFEQSLYNTILIFSVRVLKFLKIRTHVGFEATRASNSVPVILITPSA